jgi:endoglucanase
MKKLTTILLIFLSIFTTTVNSQTKIPIYPQYLWEINNGNPEGLWMLFDGITNHWVEDGWGKIFKDYDVYYEFPEAQGVTLTKMRAHDFEASTTTPTKFYYSTVDKPFEFVKFYEFYGPDYLFWHDIPMLNVKVKYIKIECINGFLPTELEFFGSYNASFVVPALKTPRRYPFKNMVGVNGKVWSVGGPKSNGVYLNGEVDFNKVALIKKTFKTFRFYAEKSMYEIDKDRYAFAPTPNGGWNYDKVLTALKDAGVEVLFDIKELPLWQMQTYPVAEQRGELAPVNYGASKELVESYRSDGQTFFQVTARYGRSQVNSSLLKTDDKKTGLDLIHKIEVNNETNAYWGGLLRYQTPYEYVMNLSVVYDGHKGTMGPGVGVKTADPTMKVIMGGSAGADAFYLRGIIMACEQIRGRKADGTIDVPFDGINYHCYQSNANMPPYPTIYSCKAGSPESTNLKKLQEDIEWLKQQYMTENIEVWQTETGYDIHPESNGAPVPLPGMDVEHTVAAFDVRTSLLYAATGLYALDYYMMEDVRWSSELYTTSGMVDANYMARLHTQYLHQAVKFLGEYTFSRWISESPRIAEFDSAGVKRYAAWHETSNGKTSVYSLPNTTFKVYGLDGSIVPKDVVTITETPVFFDKINLTALPINNPPKGKGPRKKDEPIILAYPNPAPDYIIYEKMKNEVVHIYHMSGQLVRVTKADAKGKINTQNLTLGIYTALSQTNVMQFKKQ